MQKKKPPKQAAFFKIGGDDRTRTDYLYVANVSLSQVSYAPKSNGLYYIIFFLFCTD